jgi:hypothetical protein
VIPLRETPGVLSVWKVEATRGRPAPISTSNGSAKWADLKLVLGDPTEDKPITDDR